MKKIFMFLILGIFLLSFVSAADWDNKLTYSNKDLTVNFSNSFLGIFETSGIGSIELKSHKSVKEIKRVGAGKDKAVMYYETNFKELYENGLGEVLFINMRTGEEIEKEYYFAELVKEQIPKYESICNELISSNGSKYSECSEVQNGFKQVEVWKRLDNKIIPKGKTTIGLITDVKTNDYIDAIWEVVGKEVSKHAAWTADLNTDIYLYFKFDETATTIDSVAGLNTSTTASNVTGKIGNAYQYSGSITGTGGYKPYTASINEGSINFWIKTTDVLFQSFLQDGAGVSNNVDTAIGVGGNIGTGGSAPFCGSGNLCLSINRIVTVTTSASSINDNSWHMITITVDGTTHRMYIDGLNVDNTTTGDNIFGGQNGDFGFFMGDASFIGTLDEFGFWNRSLTSLEVTQLWNEGTGITFTNIFSPIPILDSPVDFFNTTNPQINFNGIISGTNPINVSLLIDDSYNETNTSGLLGNYLFTKILSEGEHTWNYEACSVDICTNGTERTLTINTKPNINLTSPLDNANTTDVTVSFLSEVTTPNLNLDNVSLYINGILSQTNSSGIEGNYNFSETFIEQNLNWSIEACNLGGCTLSEERNLIIHLTSPTINITNPIGNFDYFLLGDSIDLNWTVEEPGTNLSEHIINCSYDYNGSTTYLSINDCVNVNSTTFIYVLDKNSLTFNMTDIFQLKSFDTTTWNYKIIELTQTFNNETTEGAMENYEADIIIKSGLSISGAAVIYNGTTYVGSSSTAGEITTLLMENLQVPTVSTDTNFSFFWTIVLSDSSIINLSTKNQTVFNLALDDCSSFSNIIFNFTSKDEELQTQLPTTTKEIAINVFSSDRVTEAFNLSAEYNSNPTGICLNRNLSEGISYSLDSIIRYEAPGYANEYYNIVNFNLSSDTTEQKIDLFNINLSDSTEFQLTFKGSDFLPVEDALVFVERQYIAENTFKTVELPKTDSNGQTVLHLVRNDIIYNIIVMKDEEVLGRFTNLIAFCDDFSIGDCKIILNAIGEESSMFDYNEQIGILFNTAPLFNETTNIVSFDFVSVDGTSKTVTLDVERRDIFGNTSVCSNILVSTSGTVSCNVGNISDTTLITGITVDGEEWIIAPVQIDSQAYGSIGYVVSFFLTLILVFSLGDSKNGIMLAIGIGYIIAVAMGFMIGGIIGAGTAGIWMIILTVLGLYQINKNKQ